MALLDLMKQPSLLNIARLIKLHCESREPLQRNITKLPIGVVPILLDQEVKEL